MNTFKKTLLLSTAFFCLANEARGVDPDENKKHISQPKLKQQLAKSPLSSSIKSMSDLYYNDDDISDYITITLQNGDVTYFTSS